MPGRSRLEGDIFWNSLMYWEEGMNFVLCPTALLFPAEAGSEGLPNSCTGTLMLQTGLNAV